VNGALRQPDAGAERASHGISAATARCDAGPRAFLAACRSVRRLPIRGAAGAATGGSERCWRGGRRAHRVPAARGARRLRLGRSTVPAPLRRWCSTPDPADAR
jgi:hypothetical protein